MNNLKKIVFLVVLFSTSQLIVSQTKLNRSRGKVADNPFGNDTSSVKRAKGYEKLATIDMYLTVDHKNDSIAVDTTLSIQKEYKFNYLQRDNFGLIPFANIGQTYNALDYNLDNLELKPLFGARARHFNYYEISDIKYYEVATPWTRLTYKTAFEQGQMLDAFFTVNLSKQFNFSIAYKGLRSLGNYQNALTSSGNFRISTNYKTKNNRYNALGHIVMQDLLNQENGGLRDEDIDNFESGEEEFIDRSVFDMNFEDAENILVGKRFYFEHNYEIVQKKDSLSKNKLTLSNTVSFEDKYYQFYKDSPSNDYFGESFTDDINDKVTLEHFNTKLGLNYGNNTLGDLDFGINYSDINYGYNSLVFFPQEIIPNRIKINFVGLTAGYSKTINFLSLTGKTGLNLSDRFKGSFLYTNLDIKLNDDIKLFGGINLNSKLPNYNYLLYQSDYINYNWYNLDQFENINTQQFKFGLRSKKYLNADVEISNINNYTYFNLENVNDNIKVIKPQQYDKSLQYVKIKAQREIKFGRFALDNTIMYQKVVSDDQVLNVPELITRNTFYYTNQLFKKAMTLQTGVIFNYFTAFSMNGYDPLLAEFYTQNEVEVGGFPRLDFFINAKVRQTRIYFKAEHFNSSITGYNYFSAPNYPFRDFIIRFGLVWDFFL